MEAKVDTEHHEIWRRGKLTRVRSFPISIDFERHVQEASGSLVESHMRKWEAELGNDHRWLGIGIDRADYTKGIPDRLWAIDRLLEMCPEYRGNLLFLQVAVPSRTQIREYQRLNDDLRKIVCTINRKWAHGRWQPIRFCNRHLPQEELTALHRFSHFCMVTSLHDGMNLVATEYVARRTDEDGVLVLSSFTGAARDCPLMYLLAASIWCLVTPCS